MKKLSALIPCLALAPIVNGATIAIDFETPDQFVDNFRVVHASGTDLQYGQVYGESIKGGAPAAPNGWLSLGNENTTDRNHKLVAIYDTTPLNNSDAAQTFGSSFTVSFGVASSTGSLFGFYLFDPNNIAKNLFVSFEINGNGQNDRIRFRHDGNLATAGQGTAYTTTTGTGEGGLGVGAVTGFGGNWDTRAGGSFESTGSAGAVNTSSNTIPVFYNLTLTYTYGTNNDTTLTIAHGTSFSATVLLSNDDAISDPGLALYMERPYKNMAKIDDIVITTVPEPASAAFLLGGIAGCLLIIRRKRRA